MPESGVVDSWLSLAASAILGILALRRSRRPASPSAAASRVPATADASAVPFAMLVHMRDDGVEFFKYRLDGQLARDLEQSLSVA